ARIVPLRALARCLAAGAIGLAATAAGAARVPAQRPAPAAGSPATPAGSPPTCIVRSLPSFVAQGENAGAEATAATVADLREAECRPSRSGTESKPKLTAAQLFSRCKGNLTWYVPNPFQEVKGKLGVTLTLDADGNATAALLAGPGCAAGESLITAHMEEEPFETFTTSFTVLPPMTTTPGVFALPESQVEDDLSSSVATIVEAEFANGSEKFVHIGSEELFHRCRLGPHLVWIREDGTV